MGGERVILHVDMDAYFASIEQRMNPHLRGKPVLVCGDPHSRTVVAAASYEAKTYGVKSGMPLREALRLCPQALLVQGSPQKYYTTTLLITEIMKKYTPLVELFSIDEAFLDVTGTERMIGSAGEAASSLKQDIYRETGLTCSVGIAPNKLLAKMASDMDKPDGLVEIRKSDVSALLEAIPVSDMCGIGKKTKEYLNRMGIYTCGQLGRYPVDLLVKRFGIVGRYLHNMGAGIDESPVMSADYEGPVKSMGHSHTLHRDSYNSSEVKGHILRLSEMVGRRLRQDGYAGRTVSLVVRYADFSTFSKQITLQYVVDLGKEIAHAALLLLRHFDVAKGIRLVGVSVSGLVLNRQLSLLPAREESFALTQATDVINDRFGESTITWASVIEREERQKVIAPGTKCQALSRASS